MTVADLWKCPECHIAHVDVPVDRTCGACGTTLEYYGEVQYVPNDLVSIPEGDSE